MNVRRTRVRSTKFTVIMTEIEGYFESILLFSFYPVINSSNCEKCLLLLKTQSMYMYIHVLKNSFG